MNVATVKTVLMIDSIKLRKTSVYNCFTLTTNSAGMLISLSKFVTTNRPSTANKTAMTMFAIRTELKY